MRAGAMERRDDLGNRIADAWNVGKPPFGDELIERHGERRQAVGGPCIGLAAIGIAAAERRALGKLAQELGYGLAGERRRHNPAQRKVATPRTSG